MIIVAVAGSHKREKIFMLAQGFMPGQNVHVVKNLMDETISPWYELRDDPKIITPNGFLRKQLNNW